MKFLIITGMSGAGKSTVLRRLEDVGYFCVDNLPLPLVEPFTVLAGAPKGEYEKAALGLDVRGIRDPQDVQELLLLLDRRRYEYEVLFLDCQDNDLIRRYKETRRSHPLSREGRIQEGISAERALLQPLRDRADYLLDTSGLLTRELTERIAAMFTMPTGSSGRLKVTVLTFGFKRGIPADADLVFDVRFLPNPYYSQSLRLLTGQDPAVQAYVLQDGTAEVFEKKWFDMLDYLLPCYVKEGKTQLVIAVGCTGGQHRSVTMALRLYAHLQEQQICDVTIRHRDMPV